MSLQARLLKRGHTLDGRACQRWALLVRVWARLTIPFNNCSVKQSAPFSLNHVLHFQTGSRMPSPDRLKIHEKSTWLSLWSASWPWTTRLGHHTCYWPTPSRQKNPNLAPSVYPVEQLFRLQWESDVWLSLCFLIFISAWWEERDWGLQRGCMNRRVGSMLGTGGPHLSPEEGVLLAPPPSSLLAPIHQEGCFSEQLCLMSSWAAVSMSPSRQPSGNGGPTHVVTNNSVLEVRGLWTKSICFVSQDPKTDNPTIWQ